MVTQLPLPPSKKTKNGHSLPIFGQFLLWPDGWMHQDRLLLGTEVGLSLGDIVLNGDPAPPSLKGNSAQFSACFRCGKNRWMD